MARRSHQDDGIGREERIKRILARGEKASAAARARRAKPWQLKYRQRDSGCDLSGYRPVLEANTNDAENLSPSLKGCFADPIEVAFEEHQERLPLSLDDPGAFTSTHHYTNPRDPDAWPKSIKVITLCRNGHARSFAMKPGEDLTVFPASALNP